MQDPVRLVLPLKDQASADIVRTQLNDLSQKIHETIQPVFVSQKINQHLKLREAKPPLVNQTCAMQVMLALHDGTYINAWTNILRHREISLQILPYSKNATASLTVFIYEMFFINELRPSLNVQLDSIRAKVFK